MRVIAGVHRGRNLKAVQGTTSRPTTDKVKESVFQMMGPFFDGGTVLDLFAGTGSLGIEAMSRGMDKAIFVDKHSKAIETIQSNLQMLRLEDESEVLRADAFRSLSLLNKKEVQFDLILVDPPYKAVDYTKVIKTILKYNLLKDQGLLYCEYDPTNEDFQVDDTLHEIKRQQYGGTIGVSIYQYISKGDN